MYLSKLMYLYDNSKYYIEYKCEICDTKPAVCLEADCHGDSMVLCKVHWAEWFNKELFNAFDKPIEEDFIKVKVKPDKYKHLDNLYIYKPKE